MNSNQNQNSISQLTQEQIRQFRLAMFTTPIQQQHIEQPLQPVQQEVIIDISETESDSSSHPSDSSFRCDSYVSDSYTIASLIPEDVMEPTVECNYIDDDSIYNVNDNDETQQKQRPILYGLIQCPVMATLEKIRTLLIDVASSPITDREYARQLRLYQMEVTNVIPIRESIMLPSHIQMCISKTVEWLIIYRICGFPPHMTWDELVSQSSFYTGQGLIPIKLIAEMTTPCLTQYSISAILDISCSIPMGTEDIKNADLDRYTEADLKRWRRLDRQEIDISEIKLYLLQKMAKKYPSNQTIKTAKEFATDLIDDGTMAKLQTDYDWSLEKFREYESGVFTHYFQAMIAEQQREWAATDAQLEQLAHQDQVNNDAAIRASRRSYMAEEEEKIPQQQQQPVVDQAMDSDDDIELQLAIAASMRHQFGDASSGLPDSDDEIEVIEQQGQIRRGDRIIPRESSDDVVPPLRSRLPVSLVDPLVNFENRQGGGPKKRVRTAAQKQRDKETRIKKREQKKRDKDSQ